MKIEDLVQKQQLLDDNINSKHKLDSDMTINQRYIALLVELAELANEIRFFKFWSLKPSSSNEIVLEEFVDCLHFVLSISITTKVDLVINNTYSYSIEECFIQLFKLTSNNIDEHGQIDEIFNLLMYLACILGFSQEDVYNAYLSKNEVNHLRQINNY